MSSDFLSAYQARGLERQRVERILAVARAFLAVVGLIAIYIDATEPVRFATLVYSLLAAYAVYSVALLAMMRGDRLRGAAAVLHAIDMALAVVLTAFSSGPISPFFLFFVFTLLAAAFRWGARETLLTTATVVPVFVAEAVVLPMFPAMTGFVADDSGEFNRLITRIAYLLMTGLLLAYLAEQQRLLRVESVAISELMRRPRVDDGLRATIRNVCEELLQMFHARAVVLAVRELATDEAYLWDVRTVSSDQRLQVRLSELNSESCADYIGSLSGSVFAQVRVRRGRRELCAYAFDRASGGLRDIGLAPAPPLIRDEVRHSFLSLGTAFGREWEGRVFLLDPADHAAPAVQLRFLESVVEHVSPTIYNVYLLRRLRVRASEAARARVGRELHDSTIQTLIAAELEVHALLRRAPREGPALATDLEHIQHVLRQEVLDLRDLMQQLRPVGIDLNHRLPDLLASVVDRFRRDTGISASFFSDQEIVQMTPRESVELVRITQEALVNVRKHSAARNVAVRLISQNGDWRLTIQDDGKGFDFDGRLTGPELEERSKGPAIIRERSRVIGAHLTIESTPNTGARLEIVIPGRGHA